MGTLGVDPARVIAHWFGEDRPVVSNDLPEGREVNRRVTVRGEWPEVEDTDVTDRYRAEPSVRINGNQLELGRHGRFATEVSPSDGRKLRVELQDAAGRSATKIVNVPDVELTVPSGDGVLVPGGSDRGCRMNSSDGAAAVVCTVRGRTEPGNTVEIDGRTVTLGTDGAFDTELTLATGRNTFGVLVRGSEGYSHAASLLVEVADRDAQGGLLVSAEAIPALTVKLPPDGTRLPGRTLPLVGRTEPGNRVIVNGLPLEVRDDGTFSGAVDLQSGRSKIAVEVQDAQGQSGRIEAEYDVPSTRLFLMAFADGEIGRLQGKGYVDAAGLDAKDDYYTDGRLAFYLKGVVAGKYLITAAFDSGREEARNLFRNLDANGTAKLLTNLDPDRYYPVYGDGSTVVYDVESQGKFYLAVDSDTMSGVVGSYPLTLNDTELSAYQRTLYGARFAYRSLSRTEHGDPDTQVVVFGAEVRQAHVHDELRATGGSVYYLSHRNVIEGSETVTLVVRDKVTGLPIRSERQRANMDYLVKYEEGRILFHRPISSVEPGGSIVDQAILSGNKVYVLVDYETVLNDFDKTGYGGRVRQQIGDRVAVGGTYIQDQLGSGDYRLEGVDAEVRLGKGTRITAEIAGSTGNDSLLFLSEDGGLHYTDHRPATAASEGTAWKAAAEVDVGEWFEKPGRWLARAYAKELEPGFFSSGSFLEQGSTKTGIDATLTLTSADVLRVRYDREERTGGGPDPSALGDTATSAADWTHTRDRWGFAVQLFDTDSGAGSLQPSRTYAAGRYWSRIGEKLTARLEHQQTLSGTSNDQTSAGVEYRALPNLALEAVATDGSQGTSAQAGIAYTKGETSVYLTERFAEDRAGQKTTTVLGAKSPLGASSKVYTEYQWEDLNGGGRTISLVGLERQWRTSRGLRLVLSGESADVNGSSGGSRSVVSGGVFYANDGALSLSSRQELRWEHTAARTQQYFTVNQIDYRVGRDLTLLGRLRFSRTENRDSGTVDAEFDERSLGLAYRPVDSNRFNALAKLTHLSDLRPAGSAVAERSRRSMDVFSVETIFGISPRVEWIAKAAARLQEETIEDFPEVRSSTYLGIQRFNLNMWRMFDLGVEYRALVEQETHDQRQGFLGELLFKPVKQFRFGVGYNFTDFSDDEFSLNDYSVSGWFVRVQGRY